MRKMKTWGFFTREQFENNKQHWSPRSRYGTSGGRGDRSAELTVLHKNNSLHFHDNDNIMMTIMITVTSSRRAVLVVWMARRPMLGNSHKQSHVTQSHTQSHEHSHTNTVTRTQSHKHSHTNTVKLHTVTRTVKLHSHTHSHKLTLGTQKIPTLESWKRLIESGKQKLQIPNTRAKRSIIRWIPGESARAVGRELWAVAEQSGKWTMANQDGGDAGWTRFQSFEAESRRIVKSPFFRRRGHWEACGFSDYAHWALSLSPIGWSGWAQPIRMAETFTHPYPIWAIRTSLCRNRTFPSLNKPRLFFTYSLIYYRIKTNFKKRLKTIR
jgi:hypothetical protein